MKFRDWFLLLWVHQHRLVPIKDTGFLHLLLCCPWCVGFHVHISPFDVIRWLLQAGDIVSVFERGRGWEEWCQSWLPLGALLTTCWSARSYGHLYCKESYEHEYSDILVSRIDTENEKALRMTTEKVNLN